MKIASKATVVALLILVPISGVVPGLGLATAHSAPRERPLQGFGAETVGGEGGTPYVVTSLGDSGPGTLRDAVSSSNRYITFSVSGTIMLQGSLLITKDYLTIDGSTAPGDGIMITAGHGGVLSALLNINGASNVIIKHLRVRDPADPVTGDCIRVWNGAHHIVVDHCSFRRGADGCFDIADNAHDVTMQWCIIAETVKNSLIRTGLYNISIHHNLFVHGDERNPQFDDAHGVDFVNNVIYDWSSNYGTRIRNGASVNLVNNYYAPSPRSDAPHTIVILDSAGPVYMSGNALPSSCNVSGTTGTRLPAPAIDEMSATAALYAVLEEAGAWPRDSEDQEYVSDVTTTSIEENSWGKIKAMYR